MKGALCLVLVITMTSWMIHESRGQYVCAPAECEATSASCRCASRTNPLGATSNAPQFIVLTFDGAVTTTTWPVIQRVTAPHRNKHNGCGIPATLFVEEPNAEIALMRTAWQHGHELASKSRQVTSTTSAQDVQAGYDWLVDDVLLSEAGSREQAQRQVRGFRAPLFRHNRRVRAALVETGFEYDSSITEIPGGFANRETCPSRGDCIFPYTFDFGTPQSCENTAGSCTSDERHAGLWEVPLSAAVDEQGNVLGAIDPTMPNALDQWRKELQDRYQGNRHPLLISLTPAFLLSNAVRQQQLNQFIYEALRGKDDVFVVTMAQLVDWMKDPVDAATVRQRLTADVQCPRVNGYDPSVWSPPSLQA